MARIPFLRPQLAPHESYAHLLEGMDQARLYSNFGPLNTRFERRVIDEWFEGVGHATTVSNATLGLMLAIGQMKRRGRYALMPSFTFAATPLAAQWCGLEPLFVDVDPDEWVVSPHALRSALERYGDEIAVVVPYATAGTHMDLEPYELLMARGVPVVVDAAASFGTRLDGVPFGKGFPGAIVYSFHATKAFAVGEAGLVYSADAKLVQRLRTASNFGFDGSREATTLGINAKVSEVTAAIALATLDRFPETDARRRALYERYKECLEHSGLLEAGFRLHKMRGMALYQWLPLLAPDEATQKAVMQSASDRGIELRRYFTPPCHEHPQFSECPRDSMSFTNELARRVLSLPLWNEMTFEMIDEVVEAVASVMVVSAR